MIFGQFNYRRNPWGKASIEICVFIIPAGSSYFQNITKKFLGKLGISTYFINFNRTRSICK